jgi:hypothetical protein
MDQKLKLFEVHFFVQSGELLGAPSEVETVTAETEYTALAEIRAQKGSGFRLSSIREVSRVQS